MKNSLPYIELFDDLVTAIHKALWYCHIQHKSGKELREDDENLSGIFERYIKVKSISASGLDGHIIKGLTTSATRRRKLNEFPRIVKLVIHAFNRVRNNEKSSDVLPSPLHILYHALTVPEEPQTASYSFVLCRGMLFHFLKLHFRHPELKSISPYMDEFSEEDIQKAISSFKSNIDIYARWPDIRKNVNPRTVTSRINYLTGHILAVKGFAYLWFKNENHLEFFCQPNSTSRQELSDRYSNNSSTEKYSFRVSSLYTELPDSAEINNWIFGIPVPWRGADLLFFGGLKRTSTNGLVFSLHGQPGTGKTSAALSLAAVLEPLGTKTLYISLEENPEDLQTRLNSLVPDYLRKMRVFENNRNNLKLGKANDHQLAWFKALKFYESLTITQITDVLKTLQKDIKNQVANDAAVLSQIPATCPLLLVIDNVNELFNKDILYDEIEKFIEQCRNMGALVVLIAAEEIPGKFKLDYLVDVAIQLKQEGIDNKYEKPIRVFQLLKTRHQISRQGAHVFHLSSSNGFRLSPQVPSQLDKRERIRINLPSNIDFIHTLDIQHDGNIVIYKPFLPVACNSQILVHGHGSSGKAGFGLKLLLTPIIDKESLVDIRIKSFTKNKIQLKSQKLRKVLILSFLYPEDYYQVLKDRLDRQFINTFQGYYPRNSMIKVQSFYPGFLTAEDFVNKIVRLLEEASLEGEPFTGVLLDGLHNVFLQFKKLQESDMIWPLLYSILKRYSVTVVTTFTNISLIDLDNKESGSQLQTPQDFMLYQTAQKPFLHGIVRAADYFLMLEEDRLNKQKNNREYLISVRSSRQNPPNGLLRWNRQDLTIYEEV